MRNHHRETEFLRQCILYDDTGERDKLEEGITRVQRDERCVRRAALLMVVMTGLSMAGLCYSAILLTDHPQSMTQFAARFVCKAFCALGLGSLICLVSFLGLGVAYRRELDQHREECRRLAVKVLESRLGKPVTPAAAAPRQGAGEARVTNSKRDGSTVRHEVAGGIRVVQTTAPLTGASARAAGQ